MGGGGEGGRFGRKAAVAAAVSEFPKDATAAARYRPRGGTNMRKSCLSKRL